MVFYYTGQIVTFQLRRARPQRLEWIIILVDLILGFIDGLLLGSARLLLIGWLYYYFVTYASRIVTYSLRKVRPQGHRTPLNFRPSRTEWMERVEVKANSCWDLRLTCKQGAARRRER